MDVERFGTRKTGQLVRIHTPKKDWGFIPDPLPPAWEFPVRLWPLLARAKESLARLWMRESLPISCATSNRAPTIRWR